MEESPPIEYRMRHKDGHYLWARAMGRIVRKKDTPSLVVITVWDITKSREMEYQLHALAERLHTVREEERTNISREIHDVFGQALTSLKFELAILARSFLPDQQNAHAKARSILQSIDEIIQLIRKISTELRPPILDDFGLKAAIEWQTADFQKKTGIKCTLNSDLENELSIDKKKAISLFRIFQEALTNVARHAGATQVVINFYYKKKKLIMQVKDNGRGISKAEMEGKTSLGLMGMRERVFSLNGDLKIEGKPEEGTVITVEVPM
jgi:signal transduction histidine kinase